MILYHIMLRFSMMYRLCDMIYGLRRMIYLLRKYDIISVPFIREAYIICEADIIVPAISSVTVGNGYHCKKPLLSSRQKRFLHGAGYGSRTRLHGLGSRCITDIRTLRLGRCHYSKPPVKKQGAFVDRILQFWAGKGFFTFVESCRIMQIERG